MTEINNTKIDRNILIDKLCTFLKLNKPKITSETNNETIKELSVARLCKSVGIWCEYNYKSQFFEFFSTIMGQAIVEKLKIKLKIAGDEFRLFKYRHKNLIDEVKYFLDTEDIDEAFIDAFNFLDEYTYLIPMLQQNKKV